VIWGSTNEIWQQGLNVADVNGRAAHLVYTNGDAFDYARPGPRHGMGSNGSKIEGRTILFFHRVGDFPGAYSLARPI